MRQAAREEWISATQFHPEHDAQVLAYVRNRVEEEKQQGSTPTVIFDLDSTLYEVGPRTYEILREWMDEEFHHERNHPMAAALKRLEHAHVGYSLKDTFHALGLDLTDPETERRSKTAKHFWAERFFTSEYLKYDTVYEGAVEFVNGLHRAGARIVYLTGRDEPGMGDGTRRRLMEDGFAWGDARVKLMLKPRAEMDDLSHKVNSTTEIKQTASPVVASFENEPKNLMGMWKIIPEAAHVFMETVYSDNPADIGKGIFRLSGFRV